MRLRDKVAIVTGAGDGIGRATALAMAREGARVVAVDIDPARLEAVAAQIRGSGSQVLPAQADVSLAAPVEAMVKQAVDTWGRVDILVNGVGGSGITPRYREHGTAGQTWVEEIAEEDWDGTMVLNLKSVFLCCRAAIPHMKRQGYGRIVNFSSIACERGMANSQWAYAAYAAAKAGVIGFTRQMARELGPFGITANCVAPGSVSNPRMEARRGQRTEEENRQALLQIPLRRISSPDEQAAALVFLASDEASYITGVTIDVNGGTYFR
ncbi:MAG: SDR family oxidoreductase [Bacteroidetes bacterium]|nr:SDR family oxidoreductase [Bacteroidota bacterium]MCL5027249.1 SDR family oxidoreductase [Chloroflexota bacterium]